MYKRKTKDEYQLWSNYGYGWEEETAYDTMKEAKQGRFEYVSNVSYGRFRIIKKRIKIEV